MASVDTILPNPLSGGLVASAKVSDQRSKNLELQSLCGLFRGHEGRTAVILGYNVKDECVRVAMKGISGGKS